MLAKENRVVRADDFRRTVRTGRRSSTEHAVVYVAPREYDAPSRFGFIVAKSVGNSVTRNLLRRRLRSISSESLVVVPVGSDLVVRALPGCGQLSFVTLHTEITGAIERGVARK